MAGLSVNKHKQTTSPVLGAQSSTKLSTYKNTNLLTESVEVMRGITNFLHMTPLNSASVATAVQSNREPPKV